MNKSYKHLPKDKRKKILLITDDIRVNSGVATVGREIVVESCHHFNWVQIAGAIKHPDQKKKMDISADCNKFAGIDDASVFLYGVDGYGDQNILRQVIQIEKPDAILLITDPRYFTFIFNMEHEIRKSIPIAYLNIWDDYPAPMYNQAFYESCDLLMGISKQTVNINRLVLGDRIGNRILKYVPHGLNHDHYKPIDDNDPKFIEFKKRVLGDQAESTKFVAFFNSRNIRRKQIPDTMLAFRVFLDSLPREEAEHCKLILHTEITSNHGTDLTKVNEYLFGENYPNHVIFSTAKLGRDELNMLYNLADVQMLLTSNEGWGLTITEAILAGTPIIANTTGGMQDQMRFVDDKGNWFTPSPDVPSNHRGTYKEHGEWAFPVYPTSRSVQGSPPTPYIFDDRCDWEDATERLKECYKLGRKELKRRGKVGREWAIGDEAGFTSKHQGHRVMEAFTELFDKWEPREKIEIINTNDYKGHFLNHKLIY
tara:strand:+ start:3022 stop:4467 length:1446 start_codon:yes stop_codon:yes gene_type:complete